MTPFSLEHPLHMCSICSNYIITYYFFQQLQHIFKKNRRYSHIHLLFIHYYRQKFHVKFQHFSIAYTPLTFYKAPSANTVLNLPLQFIFTFPHLTADTMIKRSSEIPITVDKKLLCSYHTPLQHPLLLFFPVPTF